MIEPQLPLRHLSSYGTPFSSLPVRSCSVSWGFVRLNLFSVSLPERAIQGNVLRSRLQAEPRPLQWPLEREAAWYIVPPDYDKSGCWACAKGCAVLCYLALKGLEPDEANITSNLNATADCTWKGMKHSKTPGNFPCVAQVTGRHGGIHFVIVDEAGSAFDPDAGERKTKISEYAVAGYLV